MHGPDRLMVVVEVQWRQNTYFFSSFFFIHRLPFAFLRGLLLFYGFQWTMLVLTDERTVL